MLAYLTSMDVNLCFSALMSADLHKLWCRYIKIILLPFQLGKLMTGLHDIYLIQKLGTCLTSLESQVSLGSRPASYIANNSIQIHS